MEQNINKAWVEYQKKHIDNDYNEFKKEFEQNKIKTTKQNVKKKQTKVTKLVKSTKIDNPTVFDQAIAKELNKKTKIITRKSNATTTSRILRDVEPALVDYCLQFTPNVRQTQAVSACLVAFAPDNIKVSPELQALADQIRQANKTKDSSLDLLKQTKKQVNELYHMNFQLLGLLAFLIGDSRWGFKTSSVNDSTDISRVNFAEPFVEKTVLSSRESLDKLLKQLNDRMGSNMYY